MNIEYKVLIEEDLRTISKKFGEQVCELVYELIEYELPLTRFEFERVPSERAKKPIEGFLGDNNIITVVTICGIPIAIVFARIVDIDHLKVGAIWNLYVKPEYRRKGLGREIIEKTEEMCKNLGCSSTLLSVIPDNVDSMKFYQSLGYKQQLINLGKDI